MNNEAYILDSKWSTPLNICALEKDQPGNQNTACKKEGLLTLNFHV